MGGWGTKDWLEVATDMDEAEGRYPKHAFEFRVVQGQCTGVRPRKGIVFADLSSADQRKVEVAYHLIRRNKEVERLLDTVEGSLGLDGLRRLILLGQERLKGKQDALQEELERVYGVPPL